MDTWYYDFMNLNEAVKRELVKGGLPWLQFRYIKDMVNTKIGMFEYEGSLPDKLTSQIIETALMFKSHLCFYNVPGVGVMLGSYVPSSTYNYYWKPDRVNFLALNGITLATDVKFEDIVLVRDNIMDIMPFLVIQEYLQKINDIEDKMFKVLNLASLPAVLTGNKKQANALRATAKNLGYKDPFIVADEGVVDSVKTFDIQLRITPFDVYTVKRKYMNECLSSLGIYAPEEKGERLLVDEIAAQNDYTDFIYTEAKNERARFVKECNEKFGTAIELKETYMINFKQSVEEQRELAKATNVNKENNNGKVVPES